MWAKGERLPLRPHHGLCTAYFVGEGYSGGFKQHMGDVLSILSPDDPVQLIVGVDEICSACPHNKNGVCESPTVAGHDNAVLAACGLHDGQKMTFGEFTGLVQQKIIGSGQRKAICGDCQWGAICDATPSRWAKD